MAGIGTRKQIQLIQLSPVKGAEGNWNSENKTGHNAWAEVSSVNQFRGYDNGQTQLQQTKRFKVRFRFDLYPGVDWLIRYASKEWVVSSVTKENEKQFYWILIATAK